MYMYMYWMCLQMSKYLLKFGFGFKINKYETLLGIHLNIIGASRPLTGSSMGLPTFFLALLDSVSRAHGMGLLSVVHPSSVSQLSLNLMHGFL